MKKLIKIIVIVMSVIIVLLAALILLLSIFFPAEFVRKQIEKEGSSFIGTEVKLKKLSFNIFTGLELTGFSVAQYGKGWEKSEIISLESARLKYRLFPLLFRTLSIKECVITKGVLNLERNKKAANYDYFLKKFNIGSNEKGDVTVKAKKEEKNDTGFKNNSLPVELDINRVGIDGLSISFKDTTLFDIPAKLDVKNLKLLANEVHIMKNTPAKVDGYVLFGFDGGDHIKLSAEAKTDGNLKIFDDATHEVSVTGPLNFRLYKASFISKDIKGMLKEVIYDVTEKTLGPVMKLALSNPGEINREAEKYFDGLMASSEESIKNTVKNAGDLIAKKDEISGYGNDSVKDHEKQIDSQVKDVDDKINSIDSKFNTTVDTLSKLPGINSKVDFNSYKKKVTEIKQRSLEKKNSLMKSSKTGMTKDVAAILSQNLPKQIPDYNTLKRQYSSEVAKYKKTIGNELKKYSIGSFIDTLLPDLGFLDEELSVSDLSTTVMLNKKNKNANEIKVVTDYFRLSGNAVLSDANYLDYTGNAVLNTGKFNLSYFPVDELDVKLRVTGVIPNLKVLIVEFPVIKINPEKQKELIGLILGNFLKNNYGSNDIMKSITKGVSLENINVNNIKKLIDGVKSGSLEKFGSQKDALKNNIDGEMTNLINEMNSKAQESITSPVKIPKLF